MGNNYFGDEGIKAISLFLSLNSQVNILGITTYADINSNSITDTGIAYIAKPLIDCKFMTEICIVLMKRPF